MEELEKVAEGGGNLVFYTKTGRVTAPSFEFWVGADKGNLVALLQTKLQERDVSLRFGPVKRAITHLAMLAYLTSPAIGQAKCIDRPNYRARVIVMSCVAATFDASDVFIALFPEEQVRNYEKGAKISGTFLAVEVISSTLVWRENSYRNAEFKPWAKGTRRSIFVPTPPADACPSICPAR